MMNKLKLSAYFFILLMLCGDFSYAQNSYGWERLLNSIYGINGFYKHRNSDGSKLWMVRPIGNLFGNGNYNFIKYNFNNNNWYIASHSIFTAIYYSYYVGGGHSVSGHSLPNSLVISQMDTSFLLVNKIISNIDYPPIDFRLFYSFDNGDSSRDVPYFRGKSFTGLTINPLNDSILYSASSGVIYKSTDRGFAWDSIVAIPYFDGSLKINPFQNNFIYAIDDSLFASSDGGSNFSNVLNKNLTQFEFRNSDSLIFSVNAKYLYNSDDQGLSWNKIDSLQDSVISLEIDPENENIFYAGSKNGLYKSTNSGRNFYLFNNTFSPSKRVIGLCKEPGKNFIYVVTQEAVYKCFNSYVIGIENLTSVTPETFQLYQNYPNPFNPSTDLKYSLESSARVKIRVFGAVGNELLTIVNKQHEAGTYTATFAASNYPSGIYFYNLEIDGIVVGTRKMILLK